jgi:transglutaminase-like putative cysteine protease
VIEWLWRFLNRTRPRYGWWVFCLTWMALMAEAAGVQEARWVPEQEGRLFFTWVTLAAGLVGFWLARSRLSARGAWVLGEFLGVGFVVQTVGRVLPPVAQLLAETRYLGTWLQRGLSEGRWSRVPFRTLLIESWGRLTFLVGRIADWWTVVRAGGTGQDNAPFLLLAGLVFWTAAILTMWGVYRWRRPLAGLIGPAAVLVLSVYHSGDGVAFLLLFLSIGLFLIPWLRFMVLVESWERRGVDYSPEVRLEVGVVGLALALAVFVGGMAVPSVGVPQLARWVVEHWPQTAPSNDEGVWRVFGGLRRPGPGEGSVPVAGGGLPRQHLLGGAVDLMRQPVMTVSVDEADAVPQPYWRALTYRLYTGRGWENDDLEVARYRAGQSLPGAVVEGMAGRRGLQQTIVRFDAGDRAAYVAGDPVWLDVSYRARWRAPGDLVGLETSARRYTALSLVPVVGEGALRGAPRDYPPQIVERYLQLPADLPQRVRDLARRVTADAPTPYDRALALQAFLRQFEYSLELPAPPPEQDVVAYFLFDVQVGYCDYYASAMVVMARTVGLPARLAMGYASGAYDPERGYYYVVGADAHSWPEVFVPGYGWIAFEPTAARSVFERQGADLQAAPPPAFGPPPRSPVGGGFSWVWPAVGGGAALAGLALILVWGRWVRLGRLPDSALMGVLYDRLARLGARLGTARHRSDTPVEYAHRLTVAVTRRAGRPRWPSGSLAPHARRAREGVGALAEFYLKATYSRHPLTEQERRAALRAWRGLSPRLWLLWLAGKPGGRG